jgi:hypothetical protein
LILVTTDNADDTSNMLRRMASKCLVSVCIFFLKYKHWCKIFYEFWNSLNYENSFLAKLCKKKLAVPRSVNGQRKSSEKTILREMMT